MVAESLDFVDGKQVLPFDLNFAIAAVVLVLVGAVREIDPAHHASVVFEVDRPAELRSVKTEKRSDLVMACLAQTRLAHT